MNGILLIDKPGGLTSAEVVRRVKRIVGGKVGHLGTLDPFATGVLPLCLGEATKVAQFLNQSDKRYEGVIRLGSATDTGDRTGTVIRTSPVPDLDDDRLNDLAARFIGCRLQTPPMHSAIKRDGVPLYRLAHKGIEVEREARPIQIASLRIERQGVDRLTFQVTSSKGTYIRVLAEELGTELGTVAHLEELRRTAFGEFEIGCAVSLDGWDPSRLIGLISIRQALASVPSVRLSDDEARAVRNGHPWVLSRVRDDGALSVLVDSDDSVVAVAVKKGQRWGYGRVLQPGATLHLTSPMLTNPIK